jgi:hypothetical protein
MTAPRLPGILRCLLVLSVFDAMLRVGGVRAAIRLAHRLGRSGGRSSEVDPTALASRVAAAASLYPRRALCLEQSLVLFVLLRRRGIAAELRFGVRPYPFLAHAWIEVAGEPLHERADVVAQLAHFDAVGA